MNLILRGATSATLVVIWLCGVASRAEQPVKTLIEARAAAEQIEDAYRRAATQTLIADKLAELGDARAAAVFADAFRTARTIEDETWRNIALRSISESQAHAGLHDDARRTLPAIDESFSLGTLRELSEHDVKNGRSRQALRSARELTAPSYRNALVADIAGYQAHAGMIDEALATARSIDDEHAYTRDQALSDIAYALIIEKQQSRADEVLQDISSSFWKFWAHVASATTLNGVGDAKAAQRSLRKAVTISEAIERSFTLDINYLPRIVRAACDLGKFELAVEQTKRADNRGYQTSMLEDIVAAQLNADDTSGALITARFIDPEYRDAVLKTIVAAHCDGGDLDKAEAVLTEIEWEQERAVALAAIAAEYARQAQQAKAATLFKDALQLIPESETPVLDVSELIEIAKEQFRAGMPKESRITLSEALRRMGDTEDDFLEDLRRYELSNIAIAQAKIGDVTAALKTAAKVESEERRLDTLAEIAAIQAASGRAMEALDWVKRQERALYRARGLLGVAEGLIEFASDAKDR